MLFLLQFPLLNWPDHSFFFNAILISVRLLSGISEGYKSLKSLKTDCSITLGQECYLWKILNLLKYEQINEYIRSKIYIYKKKEAQNSFLWLVDNSKQHTD